MPTEELEHELRRAVAAAADGYPHIDEARQRLLERNYRPGSDHRRLIATVTVAISAGSAALALSLAGFPGASHSTSTPTISTRAPAPSTGTNQTPGFTLISNDSTDTLTLKLLGMLDPATLQRALRHHGIPAIVRTDSYCSSSPAAPDPTSIGVLSTPRLPGKPHSLVPAPHGPVPNAVRKLVANTVTVINPAKIPSGSELFFGYFSSNHLLFAGLIHTSSYTCRTGQPPTTP